MSVTGKSCGTLAVLLCNGADFGPVYSSVYVQVNIHQMVATLFTLWLETSISTFRCIAPFFVLQCAPCTRIADRRRRHYLHRVRSQVDIALHQTTLLAPVSFSYNAPASTRQHRCQQRMTDLERSLEGSGTKSHVDSNDSYVVRV